MQQPIKKLVILGGGTSGWISAALSKKLLGNAIEVELVESSEIGTVGVGEATIPPIKLLNDVLGLNEAEFLRETQGTIKLAIKFENWKNENHSYYHTFGSAGKSMAFCHFHHFLKRAGELDDDSKLWDYDLNALCAEEGKYAHIRHQDPILEMPYAYHFDAGLYAQYLRKFCEKIGVQRTEGTVAKVHQNSQNGYIESLQLKDGSLISGDLFLDCSGFRGLLIQQTLQTGYEDWSHWLRCDRAVAVASKRFEHTLPYTRSIAHKGGWQWRIPLQHRNGNGLVYNSGYYSDDEATELLLGNLDSKAITDPKVIKFQTGRRYQQWNKNVIAVGLSSGFLEPLESTSIHLIQSAVVRLIHLFPHHGINDAMVDEYNKQSKLEFEQIRDFIILHYHVNQRTDSLFWQEMRDMKIPETLAHKIELFKQDGRLFRDQNDLFLESSWLQVMLGQGLVPNSYHPMANAMPESKLKAMLEKIKAIKREPVSAIPSHDEFLKRYCGQ
ncbi:tryptophan halogenase family protein [Thalassotalea sp. PS06]|uniref:tryptophan halogenase family protein n=1 Tax=Thalassotalea sp. PS06 TaxID=2594005 RepID=UPI00116394B5|nr:tryptophan halogenase family protein [Thalassotalea sp. PS06]QDP02705.1 tryptophan 7-halogenase [Thalassotalea sp. PS06]